MFIGNIRKPDRHKNACIKSEDKYFEDDHTTLNVSDYIHIHTHSRANPCCCGRAIAQMVSRWLPSTAARFQFQSGHVELGVEILAFG
jgi:hypothetical protein